MHAFQVTSFAQPASLQTIAAPVPATGEVLLEIAACGLNFADLLMETGRYQDTPTPPFTLGMEVCGTVIGHADGVQYPPIGTRVAVFGGHGGMAQRGVFAANLCRPVPDTMDDATAAGFMVAYGTSHLALSRRAKLQDGETLLVLGAAGGVGLTAVEIGKAMGANVIAVARGADKLAVAKQAGADHLIDSDTHDIKAAVKALGGADVVYDPVGGESFQAALGACNREARIIVIGFASGDVPQIPANIILVKNITVIGFYWGGYLKFDAPALTESLATLMAWHAQGRLNLHVSHKIPLADAADALALLRDRKSTGKVVVMP